MVLPITLIDLFLKLAIDFGDFLMALSNVTTTSSISLISSTSSTKYLAIKLPK
jgi:hypothetical protein